MKLFCKLCGWIGWFDGLVVKCGACGCSYVSPVQRKEAKSDD